MFAVRYLKTLAKTYLPRSLQAELAACVSHPARWVALPGRSVVLSRRALRGRKWRARVSPLRDAWDKEGGEGVVAAVRTQVGDIGPRRFKRELLGVAVALGDAGHSAAAYTVAQAALRLDGSDREVRQILFAAALEAGEADAGLALWREEKRRRKALPARVLAALLGEGGEPSIARLALSERVQPRRERQDRPVAGRLCYIVHAAVPYSTNGYATRTHGIARGLAAHGWDVEVLTRPGFPFDLGAPLAADQVRPVEHIDGQTYIHLPKPSRRGRSELDYMVHAVEALEAILRDRRPEVVVAASNYVTALPALIAARRLGIPFVYEVRGFWEITRLSREPGFEKETEFLVQRRLESATAAEAGRVLTLTGGMVGELQRRGVDSSKVSIVPNACDPDRFAPQPRDDALAGRLGLPPGIPVIGYIGSLVAYEGLDDLAEACGRLKARGYEFRLLLVGGEARDWQGRTPITQSMIESAERHGFGDWFLRPGRVPFADVASYYSLIDITPFPRKALPVCELVSPLKPLEAMAMGKAVVASDVAPLAEIVTPEKNGLLFEKGDVESLTRALARLLDDRALCGRMGKAARTWAITERTWEQAAGVASAACRDLLAARSPVAPSI